MRSQAHQSPQRLSRPALRDPGRDGRSAHPEAAEGDLLPRLSGAAAYGAEKALTAVVQEAYVQGISARSVDDLVKALGMSRISKSQVSRLCEEKVRTFLGRPLEGE